MQVDLLPRPATADFWGKFQQFKPRKSVLESGSPSLTACHGSQRCVHESRPSTGSGSVAGERSRGREKFSARTNPSVAPKAHNYELLANSRLLSLSKHSLQAPAPFDRLRERSRASGHGAEEAQRPGEIRPSLLARTTYESLPNSRLLSLSKHSLHAPAPFDTLRERSGASGHGRRRSSAPGRNPCVTPGAHNHESLPNSRLLSPEIAPFDRLRERSGASGHGADEVQRLAEIRPSFLGAHNHELLPSSRLLSPEMAPFDRLRERSGASGRGGGRSAAPGRDPSVAPGRTTTSCYPTPAC